MVSQFAVPAIILTAGVVSFFSPLAGVLALIACIPYDVAFELGITFYLNQLVLLGVLAGVVLRNRQWAVMRRMVSGFWIAALAIFSLAVFASAVNAEHAGNVVKQWLRWMEIPLSAWVIYASLRTRWDMKMMVMVMIGSAVIASLVGIVQTIAGPDAALNAGMGIFTVDQGATMRAYSSFGHPNQFAGYLIMAIPITFIQFVEVKEFARRAWVGFLAVVMLTALIFTFSRGGWLAMTLIGGILIYLNIPKKMKMIIALMATLVVTVVILYQGPLERTRQAVMHRVVSFTQPKKEDSVGFRKVCLTTAMKMVRQHPWVGFGAGEYDRNIRQYFDEKYYAWEAINKHIHSWYLQIWIEIGLAGLGAFLFLCAALFFRLGRMFFACKRHYERQLLSGVIGALAAFMIHNLFDVLTVYARGLHFGVMIGLGLAVCGHLEKTKLPGKTAA